jgi:hypothetical protein
LQIARLKKRKLQLKDQIAKIEDYLTPDIIAQRASLRASSYPRGTNRPGAGKLWLPLW